MPGQAHARVQKISLTRPGQAATTFCAPLTETALQAPEEVPAVGIVGAEYPPKPDALELQHLKAEGPGHWLDTVVPAQSEVHRQLPLDPLAQVVLEQHLTSEGSEGHPPVMVTPPEALQVAVVTQTPATPPEP